MKLPNGTRAKVDWYSVGDAATILGWDGIPTGNIGLKGTKMAVTAWVIDFAFSENLVKSDFVKAFLEKALDKGLIHKEELKAYGG